MSSTSGQRGGLTARSPQDQRQQQSKKKPQGKQFRKIADLDYVTIRKLASRLDIPGDKNWRRLIEMMPSVRYDTLTVEKFGLNANKADGSPGYALLSDMSSRGVTYDQLTTALKRMQFDTALQEIGYRESVKITQQPEATPGVEGQQLVLECRATGVPSPNFLWFKAPNTPLPDQTSDTLLIQCLAKEDEGKYCCRAENEVNIVFTPWVEVKVQKPHILKNVSLPGSHEIIESPTIVMQSPEEVTVQVGEELRLFVEATCAAGGQLSYQWFRDSKKLNYGTSSELLMKHMRLEDQGTYSCRVSSQHGGSCLTNSTQVIAIDPHQQQQQPTHPSNSQVNHVPLHSSPAPPRTVSQHTQMPSPLVATTCHAALSPTLSTALYTAPDQMITVPLSGEQYPPQLIAQHYVNAPPGLYPNNPQGVGYPVTMPQPHESASTPFDNQQFSSQQYLPDPHFDEYSAYNNPTGAQMLFGGQEVMSPMQHENNHHMPAYNTPPHTGPHTRNPQCDSISSQVVEVDLDGACGQDEPADLNDSCYDKVALLIGNKHYLRGELKLNTPENDAQDMAGVLLSADFKVVSLVNLNKAEMEAAVKYFESLLGKNVYALFFFAGHGFELNSKSYMMPVDADVEKNPDQCLCAQQVLQTMQSKGAKLSIVLLDMCRVNASTVSFPSGLDLFPAPQGANGYFVIGFSCSPMERAFEAGAGPELKEEDRDNSIFVSAFKRHLQAGSLGERLDTLLTDAAAGVRERGKAFNMSLSWQKPEIRHNLGEQLSLADPIKSSNFDTVQRKERALLWQSAHIVPNSVVVGCLGNSKYNVKPGELALRLHFEAEHSNVLIVTAELLNGCLTTCEVLHMDMSLKQYDEKTGRSLLSLKCHEDNKQYKYKENFQFSYNNYQPDKEMDLMHFKIPDLQKIITPTVTLEVVVEYTIERRGKYREQRRCDVVHEMSPPLYAKILNRLKQTPSTSQYVQPYSYATHLHH